MTRTYNDRRNEIVATAAQTALIYDWRLDSAADMVVTEKVKITGVVRTMVITTDYTISGVGVDGGGTVDLVVGAAVDDLFILEDNRQPERTQDYSTAGDLLADTLDGDMDRRVDIIMNHERQLDRSLHLAPIELNAVSMELPVAVAGEAWRWDAAATAIEHFTPISDIGDDVALCFGVAGFEIFGAGDSRCRRTRNARMGFGDSRVDLFDIGRNNFVLHSIDTLVSGTHNIAVIFPGRNACLNSYDILLALVNVAIALESQAIQFVLDRNTGQKGCFSLHTRQLSGTGT